MSKIKDDVCAAHASWTCLKTTGNAIECSGSFRDRDSTMGAVAYFFKSGIMNHKVRGNQMPNLASLREGDFYVIHLKREWGDNLLRFADFAKKHHIEIRDTTARKISEKKEPYLNSPPLPAFCSAPDDLIKRVINKLNWQSTEDRNALLVTHDPIIAFQVSSYLKTHKYLDTANFERINANIIHSEPNAEFRIATAPGELERFQEEFPDAGNQKPPLSKGYLSVVYEKSLPIHPRFKAGILR